jgi:hypothetical protein
MLDVNCKRKKLIRERNPVTLYNSNSLFHRPRRTRNPVTLYNSNSLFHRPRRTSRQLSTAKPLIGDADPMMLLAIREQTGGSVPMGLSVVALFGPLFDVFHDCIPPPRFLGRSAPLPRLVE